MTRGIVERPALTGRSPQYGTDATAAWFDAVLLDETLLDETLLDETLFDETLFDAGRAV
jgi:hypothetical protein